MSLLRPSILSSLKKTSSTDDAPQGERKRGALAGLRKRIARTSLYMFLRPKSKTLRGEVLQVQSPTTITSFEKLDEAESAVVETRRAGLHLDSLPYDTLLSLFLCIDVEDAFSLSQVREKNRFIACLGLGLSEETHRSRVSSTTSPRLR